MHEIRIERRRLASVLVFVRILLLVVVFVGRARAQAPAPSTPAAAATAPSATPAATSPAPLTVRPAPIPTPPASIPPTAPAAAPVSAPPTMPPPPPTKEQLAEAKKFFEAGLRLEKEGLYQEALASFLEANRITPRESIQNNLALTYRLLKDLASAYDAYEVLLATYGDKMKPLLKDQAQHALEELEVLTGVVAVGIQEPGAKLAVDGKELGQTPFPKPIRLNIGSHAITVTKDGFDPFAQSIEIRGHDSVSLNGPLVKTVLTGHLAVDVKQTTPPDPSVKIYLDTRDVGPPPYQGDIDPGVHTIEARGDKTTAIAKQIQVDRKGSYAETLELHPQSGTMVVNVDVADSEIALDGAVAARGVYEGVVAAGTHVLIVRKPGYVDFKKDILLHDGERLVENVALQREGQAITPPPHDWRGLYSHLDFIGLFEVTKPSNDVAQGVGYTPDTAINSSSVPFGGGLGVRVGYSFGYIGIEGILLLGYDHSGVTANVKANDSTVTHPATDPAVGRVEDYDFNRLGGTIAVGARLMPKMEVFRPTFGLGFGVSLKTIFYDRSIEGTTSDETTNPAFYAAPAITADGGIELGSTPGTRFYLGCLFVADFASATAITTSWTDPNYPPPTKLNGVNGTDVFLGPILGMQFGE